MPTTTAPCPFCQIVSGQAPAAIVAEWDDAVAFKTIYPVVKGHTLVIPKTHVTDFSEDPTVSAAVMGRAAQLAQEWNKAANLFTNIGQAAGQTVFHLHVHLVPRNETDGLAIRWDRFGVRRAA